MCNGNARKREKRETANALTLNSPLFEAGQSLLDQPAGYVGHRSVQGALEQLDLQRPSLTNGS